MELQVMPNAHSVRNQLAGTVKVVKLGVVIFFVPNYTSNVSVISDSKTLSASVSRLRKRGTSAQ